jgi:hypothetical protein
VARQCRPTEKPQTGARAQFETSIKQGILRPRRRNSLQLRRATLYPAELRVLERPFSRLAGRRQRLAGAGFGENGSVGVRVPSFRRRSHVRSVPGCAEALAPRVWRVFRAGEGTRLRPVIVPEPRPFAQSRCVWQRGIVRSRMLNLER